MTDLPGLNELLFGKRRRSPRRTRRSPRRTRRSPRRTRRSPRRTRRSPRRCTKALSLTALRRLALENGVNIYSEAKVAISKRTGMPKKPKMVGCSTLKKRLDQAGLGELYRTRELMANPGMDSLFMEYNLPQESPSTPFEMLGPYQMLGPCGMNQVYRGGNCTDIVGLSKENCTGDDLLWNITDDPPKCVRKSKPSTPPSIPLAAPATLVTPPPPGWKPDPDGGLIKDTPILQMDFGRYAAGARPRLTQKHVGEIVVKGRVHQVFKGTSGGLYYMKGRSGDKIYIDRSRLKKSPKRTRRSPRRSSRR